MVRTPAVVTVAAAVLTATLFAAAPAKAQFFLKAKEFPSERAIGTEPGLSVAMPGATTAEQRAGIVWTMRAALNVAALQCQFEPTLLTVQNYNAILRDHSAELAASFGTLEKYFARTGGTKAAGQSALDQFGTRTYASFATVAAQYNFCRIAGLIGYDAIGRPRGAFGELSLDRIKELRASLVPYGEQQFGRVYPQAWLPRFEKQCWSGKKYKLECGYPQ